MPLAWTLGNQMWIFSVELPYSTPPCFRLDGNWWPRLAVVEGCWSCVEEMGPESGLFVVRGRGACQCIRCSACIIEIRARSLVS